MDGAEREVAKVEKKAEPIKDRIQELQTALSEKNNQVQTLQNNLSQVQAKIQNVKAQKDNLINQISSDQKELAQTVESLAKATSDIPNIENQIVKVNENIPKVKSAIADLQVKLKQLQSILPSAQQGFRDAQNELNENDHRINHLNREYYDLTEQSRNLRSRFDQIQRDYQMAEQQSIEMQNLIATNRDRIQYDQNLIPQLEKQSASLQQESQKLALDIESASKSVALALKRVKDRDAEFQKSTKLASQTYTKLLEIKKKYQALLDEASKLGSKLGSASAISGADSLGVLDGELDGLLLGAIQGKIRGLIDGFEKGKLEGQKQGQIDGKSHGSNVSSSDPEASAEGQKFGLKVAQSEANLVTYVEARNSQYKALMSLPVSSGPIEIINEVTSTISSGTKVNPDAVTRAPSTEPVSSANNNEMATMALAKVPKKKPTTPVNTSLKICTDLSNTAQWHKAAPVEAVISDECTKLKYSMQIEECNKTYLKTFQAQWDLTYKKSFNPAAIKTCIVSYDEQFKLNQLVRFQEGYDQTYEMSFRQSDKAAAQANKKSIYLDSRLKTYKENIDNLKLQAQQKGIDDENLKFSQSSVLSFEAIKLTEINENIFQNEGRIPFELSLTINNHSSNVDSIKGEVQVRVIPITNNLTVEHKTALIPLVSIPKSTQVDLRQVSKLLFKNTVAGKEKVSLKVQVLFPTGESFEKVLETKL